MIEFKLPALGADMDEGTLLEWQVQPGDVVKKGQIVAVVDTTKAAIDVEIWQEGTIHELVAQPGDKLPVGALMALLLAPGEEAGEAPPPAPRRKVSPAARKRAKELGVDVEALAGTGPGGSVSLEDVEKAAGTKVPPVPADRAALMRQTIAAAMARSKREIPHYYLTERIPMARALEWMQAQNAQRPMAERLLPAVLLLKAVALALKTYPELNGFYRDGFVAGAGIHLGVAISLRQGGLIAPAILDADRLSLTALMQALADLVKRTRAGALRSSEIGESTITVTNLGDEGSETVLGVIYPPQVALVGFGRICDQPWVEAGQLTVMPLVVASLSADHRVSDGHRGALFLREIADLLQRPEELA